MSETASETTFANKSIIMIVGNFQGTYSQSGGGGGGGSPPKSLLI